MAPKTRYEGIATNFHSLRIKCFSGRKREYISFLSVNAILGLSDGNVNVAFRAEKSMIYCVQSFDKKGEFVLFHGIVYLGAATIEDPRNEERVRVSMSELGGQGKL